MIVQHNLLAMNANRMYTLNDKKRAKIAERLSSGYRINRSADDAAGVAISEKMRRQIRGLTQAALNAQDGISLVQIADGAMAEVDDMLHRGTELSVKAANGTLSDEDRSYIQKEIEQLKAEINSIADKTTFNEIQVLKGKDVPVTEENENVVISGGMPSWITMGSQNNMSETFTTEESYLLNGSSGTVSIRHAAATIDFSSFTGNPDQIEELIDNGFYTTCCTCTNHYSVRFTDSSTNSMETSGEHYIYNIGIKNVTNAEELLNQIISGTENGNPGNHYTKFTLDNSKTKLIVYDDRSMDSKPDALVDAQWNGWNHVAFGVKPQGNYGKFGPGTAYSVDDGQKFRSPTAIVLQVGSEAGQQMELELPSISSRTIGIAGVSVTTQANAMKAINSFKKAVSYVSSERSRMGAYQNRLEHVVNNLNNVVENTQASESAIRDTDMADMMVQYANANLIAQAGQAIMAQANQLNQSVLQLLQN